MRTVLFVVLAAWSVASAAQSADSFLNRMRKAQRATHEQSFATFQQDLVGTTKLQESLPELNDSQLVERARKKLVALYAEMPVTATIRIADERSNTLIAFDCVPRASQPSVRNIKAVVFDTPPRDPEREDRKERFANAKECPAGSIPFQRQTLFEAAIGSGIKNTAINWDAKAMGTIRPLIDERAIRVLRGDQNALKMPAAPGTHRYAHAGASVENYGAASRLSIWSPVVPADQFSLSQIWVVGDSPVTPLQTVEAGWQVYALWNPKTPAIFVYSTADNYSATGCYVTKCNIDGRPESFVIVNNKPLIGLPLPQQSQAGGQQVVTEIKWIRKAETGNWWLKIDDEWVGYYPGAFFGPGPLSKSAQYVDFGGETFGFNAGSQMGSGHFSSEGKDRAAFHSRMRYLDKAGKFVALSAGLQPFETSSQCYTASLNKPVPPEANAEPYLYFGGPGAKPGC